MKPNVDKLRQTILQLAVEGKLVPQDPSDEPASKLLEQINEERQKLVKEGKIREPKSLPLIEDDEKPFEIPESWEWTRVGSISQIKGGKRLPKGSKLLKEPTDHVYIRVVDMVDGSIEMGNLHYISEDTHRKISNYTISSRDIYITIAGSIGRVGKIPESLDGSNLTENAAKIVFNKLKKDFLIFALASNISQNQFRRRTTTAAQPKLALKRIELTVVPVPPLEEQKRIVAKVDELMELCDELESKSDNFLETISKLRQTILQLAVEGKLVSQDLSNESASELLKQIEAEKQRLEKEEKIRKSKPLPPIEDNEKPYKIPENWVWVRLANLGEVNPRNQANNQEAVSFAPMDSIPVEYGNPAGYKERKWLDVKQGFTHFMEGDVLVAKVTPCFENGKVTIAKYLIGGIGAGTTELHVFRGPQKHVLPGYIYIIFKSPRFLHEGEAKMTGTSGLKRVPKDFVQNYQIPLPPLEEQKRIVAKVDELMELCDELESKLEASFNN